MVVPAAHTQARWTPKRSASRSREREIDTAKISNIQTYLNRKNPKVKKNHQKQIKKGWPEWESNPGASSMRSSRSTTELDAHTSSELNIIEHIHAAFVLAGHGWENELWKMGTTGGK